jgi:non-homologous end joining protein Ku
VRMEEEPAADLGLVAGKELELAKMLVEAQRAPFDAAKLKDKFQERVLDLVEKRAATAVPGVRSGGLPKQQEPAADLMDALRKSLEAARKPAQSETSGRAPRKKEKRGAK